MCLEHRSNRSSIPESSTLEVNRTTRSRDVVIWRFQIGASLKVTWRRTRMNIKKLFRKNYMLSWSITIQQQLLIAWILAEEIDNEIGHFSNFWTSVTLTLTLDRVMWHTYICVYVYVPVALTDLYLRKNFVQIRKYFLSTDREMNGH